MLRTSLLRPLLIGLLTCLLCQLITAKCPSPPYLKKINASPKQISEDEYETGADVQYECDEGYGQESGLGISTCQSSGNWSEPDIKCEAVQCGNPGKLQDGKTIGTDFKFGGIITFECDQGYSLWSADGTSKHHHSPEIVCNADAKWSGTLPQCLPVQCPELPEIANGQTTITSREYGGKVVYSCDQGFRHKSGDLERRCSADGTWTGTSAVCGDNNCEDPETEEYLKRNQYIEKCVVEGSLEPGNKAKCTCKGESVEKTITCLNNGVWEVPCKGPETTLPPSTLSTETTFSDKTGKETTQHPLTSSSPPLQSISSTETIFSSKPDDKKVTDIVPTQDTTSTGDDGNTLPTQVPSEDKNFLQTWIIVVLIFLLIGIALAAIIAVILIHRRKRSSKKSPVRKPLAKDAQNGIEMKSLNQKEDV